MPSITKLVQNLTLTIWLGSFNRMTVGALVTTTKENLLDITVNKLDEESLICYNVSVTGFLKVLYLSHLLRKSTTISPYHDNIKGKNYWLFFFFCTLSFNMKSVIHLGENCGSWNGPTNSAEMLILSVQMLNHIQIH